MGILHVPLGNQLVAQFFGDGKANVGVAIAVVDALGQFTPRLDRRHGEVLAIEGETAGIAGQAGALVSLEVAEHDGGADGLGGPMFQFGPQGGHRSGGDE